VRLSADGPRCDPAFGYQCVHPHAFETGGQASKGIGTWIAYHNQRQPHFSLDGQTPDEAYCPCPRRGRPKRQRETCIRIKPPAKLSS